MSNRIEFPDRIPRHVPQKSEVREDGLRYVAKVPGTTFAGPTSGYSGAMLSCFFCGTHRSGNARKHQKVLGRSQVVCDPPCPKNARAFKAAQLGTLAQELTDADASVVSGPLQAA